MDRFDEATRTNPFDASVETLLEHGANIAPTVMAQAEWDRLVASERRLGRDISIEGRPL